MNSLMCWLNMSDIDQIMEKELLIYTSLKCLERNIKMWTFYNNDKDILVDGEYYTSTIVTHTIIEYTERFEKPPGWPYIVNNSVVKKLIHHFSEMNKKKYDQCIFLCMLVNNISYYSLHANIKHVQLKYTLSNSAKMHIFITAGVSQHTLLLECENHKGFIQELETYYINHNDNIIQMFEDINSCVHYFAMYGIHSNVFPANAKEMLQDFYDLVQEWYYIPYYNEYEEDMVQVRINTHLG